MSSDLKRSQRQVAAGQRERSHPLPCFLGSWDHMAVWPPQWAIHSNHDSLVIFVKIRWHQHLFYKEFLECCGFCLSPSSVNTFAVGKNESLEWAGQVSEGGEKAACWTVGA